MRWIVCVKVAGCSCGFLAVIQGLLGSGPHNWPQSGTRWLLWCINNYHPNPNIRLLHPVLPCVRPNLSLDALSGTLKFSEKKRRKAVVSGCLGCQVTSSQPLPLWARVGQSSAVSQGWLFSGRQALLANANLPPVVTIYIWQDGKKDWLESKCRVAFWTAAVPSSVSPQLALVSLCYHLLCFRSTSERRLSSKIQTQELFKCKPNNKVFEILPGRWEAVACRARYVTVISIAVSCCTSCFSLKLPLVSTFGWYYLSNNSM